MGLVGPLSRRPQDIQLESSPLVAPILDHKLTIAMDLIFAFGHLDELQGLQVHLVKLSNLLFVPVEGLYVLVSDSH